MTKISAASVRNFLKESAPRVSDSAVFEVCRVVEELIRKVGGEAWECAQRQGHGTVHAEDARHALGKILDKL